ncbi:DNA translocase FtsK [Roseovarius atlanticus]|uniref:DNA translocase FtsK n=1 Tax=Roseovarius atlanticus TaxID=1641875 RepID=UPI001C98DE75|nr:DNA translocase FtsK [Roseovarius atlanticus]MBY5986719.1 DNA translocase FtsK 4TM domain-containing protein [Roseovarius atlanticus]MBY6125359.1 DNA translocase FtsK 4TM domain-containing protein [Roseovarius atlanticus]MBY6150180.1 DNA translocase FtsK 4TM domain-containing protein [Roseovarius atlanticus]
MAYQTRGRDPLLDSSMAEAIEKRGKELLGLALLALGLAAAMMIASYNPDDPSWMAATDAPVQNLLGRMGASIAAPLFMIVGWGAWGLAIVLGAWGVRFALHRGQDRAIGRLIYAPIWIALLAMYASSLEPSAEWSASHSFDYGGLFGEMALGTVLGFLPISATFGLKLLSLLLAVGMVALGAFILGFSRLELSQITRFLVVGTIMTYATLRAVLARSGGVAAGAAKTAQAKAAERWDRRMQERAEAHELALAEAAVPEPRVRRAEPALAGAVRHQGHAAPVETAVPGYEVSQAPEKTGGLLSRMPSLMRRPERTPEPELIEASEMPDMPAPSGDRVSAKIADVIKSRVRKNPAVQVETVAPLTRGRGRGPDPLILNTAPRSAVRAEPPLTAEHAVPDATHAPVHAPMQEMVEAAPEDEVIDDGYGAYDSYGAEPEVPVYTRAATPQEVPAAEPKKVVQHPPRRAPQPSARAQAEAQPKLQFEEKPQIEYELPPLNLLTNPVNIQRHHLSDESLEENARMLETVLDDYGVKGEIVSVRPGPVVTMYELEPAPGLKASRVIGLADDIARSMSALSARVSTVPGRSVIGIELPNDNREMVSFREILSSRDYGDGNQKLPLALGKDIGGDPMVANLAKMPHLLIAGTTGSGKSVAINTMILSLLYKLTPEDLRLVMIDPKMLELSVYDGIPHLLSPVVTDPKKAVVALKWVVAEMEDRYRKMSKMGVRNIDGYNSRVADALAKGEMFSRTVQTGFDDETGEPVFETEEFAPEKMPFIVVIVDEMADLMMVAGKEIEACIQRLAQMARASGIHLIMATQRPSVDVITGTIKANFPTRISFQVTSKIDSRTILGEMGAEQLLGMGDMLYMAGGGKITRCHGPFVSDEEVEEVVNHLKAFGPPVYVGGVQDGPEDEKADKIDAVLGLSTGGNTDGEDALYDQAVQIAITDRKCSTSYIQRKLAIGYNKAARLVEQMEDEGVVSAANHVGKREILVPEQ